MLIFNRDNKKNRIYYFIKNYKISYKKVYYFLSKSSYIKRKYNKKSKKNVKVLLSFIPLFSVRNNK